MVVGTSFDLTECIYVVMARPFDGWCQVTVPVCADQTIDCLVWESDTCDTSDTRGICWSTAIS